MRFVTFGEDEGCRDLGSSPLANGMTCFRGDELSAMALNPSKFETLWRSRGFQLNVGV